MDMFSCAEHRASKSNRCSTFTHSFLALRLRLVTRLEFIPEDLEELLQASSLPLDFVFKVRATWMRVLRWLSMLNLVHFRVDFLHATGEAARAKECVNRATLR